MNWSELSEFYLNGNTWNDENGEVNQKVIDSYGALEWCDFMEMCLRILREGKGFEKNMIVTQELLNVTEESGFTKNDVDKYIDIMSISDIKFKRDMDKIQSIRTEIKENGGKTTLNRLSKMTALKKRVDGEGWYYKIMSLATIKCTNYLLKQHTLVKRYPDIIRNINSILVNIVACDLENIKDEDVNKTITEDKLKEEVLPNYLRSLDFLLKIRQEYMDNYTASYYSTKIITEDEYCKEIANKMWEQQDIEIRDLFEEIKPDANIVKTLTGIFSEFYKAYDEDVGIWIYPGYCLYLLEKGFNIEELEKNKTCLHEIRNKHPLASKLDEHFRPPTK